MKALPAHDDLEIDRIDPVWQGRFPLQRVWFRQRRFDGTMSKTRSWELWRRGRAAALLPYDPRSDRVVLIEQWRLAALAAGHDPVMREIPAGLCEADEAPEATMRRECREEAGLEIGRILPIGDYVLSAGGSDETVAVFIGEAAAPAHDGGGFGLPEEGEDIRVVVQPAEDAIAQALAGALPNSVATIALLWLGLRRVWLRAQWT